MEPPHPSIYVHVPFCRSRCSYCSFVSYATGDPGLETAVIMRIVSQAIWWADRLGGLRPNTVFIGGGTPSAISPATLEILLEGLARLFRSAPVEYTIEANPDSISPEFLSICSAHGVNRLSLGIQTFAPAVRRSAGRRCPEPDIHRCRELVGERWRGALSLDLIAGFSAQRTGDVRTDVGEAVEWRPEHISLYTLTLDEHPGGLRCSPRADELWLEGFDALEEMGYPNYEICNFAPGANECRHNLVYWRLDPYLGLGPSAVSTLPGEGGVPLRIQTPPDLPVFLREDPATAVEAAERLAPLDLLFDTLIMGLRLRDGIGKAVLERRFGAPLEAILPRTLAGWADRALLAPVEGRLALTRPARLVLDSLLLEAREEMETLSPDRIGVTWP